MLAEGLQEGLTPCIAIYLGGSDQTSNLPAYTSHDVDPMPVEACRST